MAYAHRKLQWEHTSALAALIINALRDRKREKPVTPEELNPYMNNTEPSAPRKRFTLDKLKRIADVNGWSGKGG